MHICIKCKAEMKCIKTGFNAVWGNWAKRGDVFQCPHCEATVLCIPIRNEGFVIKQIDEKESVEME